MKNRWDNIVTIAVIAVVIAVGSWLVSLVEATKR